MLGTVAKRGDGLDALSAHVKQSDPGHFHAPDLDHGAADFRKQLQLVATSDNGFARATECGIHLGQAFDFGFGLLSLGDLAGDTLNAKVLSCTIFHAAGGDLDPDGRAILARLLQLPPKVQERATSRHG